METQDTVRLPEQVTTQVVTAAPVNTGGGFVDKAVPIAVGQRTQLCALVIALAQTLAAFDLIPKHIADTISTVAGGFGATFLAAKLERGTPDAAGLKVTAVTQTTKP